MKKYLLNLSLVLVFPLGIALLDGCYPNDSISTSETDIVMTAYDDSVVFTSLKTYFMSDTVYPVRDDTSDHSLIENNSLVIQTIAENMAAYGYERVFDDAEETPDIKIASAAIQTVNVSVGWWYPYYGGWGWGWGINLPAKLTIIMGVIPDTIMEVIGACLITVLIPQGPS